MICFLFFKLCWKTRGHGQDCDQSSGSWCLLRMMSLLKLHNFMATTAIAQMIDFHQRNRYPEAWNIPAVISSREYIES